VSPARATDDQKQIARNLMGEGFGFVTHEELNEKISHLETKIEREGLRTKLWVVMGCLSLFLGGGGAYVSLVNKLDRLSEALPPIAAKQDARAPWIQRQDQRDNLQDQTLRKLDNSYEPMPYEAPPQ
jgi:hypothetical protein